MFCLMGRLYPEVGMMYPCIYAGTVNWSLSGESDLFGVSDQRNDLDTKGVSCC